MGLTLSHIVTFGSAATLVSLFLKVYNSGEKDFNKTVRKLFGKHKNLNAITSELPSIESMGFDVKVVRAFPYHPMTDVYLCHMKIDFENYKVWSLDKRLPSLEEVLRRYWRKRLLVFLKREYSKMGLPMPQIFRKEEDFFQNHPQLWDKWQQQKAKHILLETKRCRFAKREHDFAHFLQYKWMADKKYEYFQRYTGLREEPYWRKYTRTKCLNNYANVILWCSHWKCWKIRIQYFPFNFYMWIRFLLYLRLHPEIIDIH